MAGQTAARSLAEQIADSVASEIVRGHYGAGEKISETEIAARLGVSRGPVRDALTLLEHNMLVMSVPRKYTMVNSLTVRELEHLFEFRQHVLGIASQYAALNRLEEDLTLIRRAFDQLLEATKQAPGEIRASAFHSNLMWDAIIDASHSHVVRQGCLNFTGSNIWMLAVQDRLTDPLPRAVQENRAKVWVELISSIEDRREDDAYKFGTQLVRENWQYYKKIFASIFPEE